MPEPLHPVVLIAGLLALGAAFVYVVRSPRYPAKVERIAAACLVVAAILLALWAFGVLFGPGAVAVRHR